MSRSGVPSGFSDTELRPFFGIELFFDSGTIRFWNGYQPITVGGNTFIGTGSLLSISTIQENVEIRANGMEIELNGIPSDIIALALTEPYQNRDAKIYTGTVSEDLTVDSYLAFSGLMDTMSIAEDGGTARVTLTLENQLITLERTRELRYTSREQKRLFSGDRGLDFVDNIQNKTIEWGKNYEPPKK